MSNYDEFSSAARDSALIMSAEEHIEGQHVVSRVVLKNFEGQVGGARKIGVYSTRFGPTRPIGRSRAGLAPNLLRVGSTSAEKLWKRSEDHIDGAVDAVRQHGASAPPLSFAWLRRATELHFARSKVTVEVLDGLWDRRGPHLVAAIIERYRDPLMSHLFARTGRRPSESELVAFVNETYSDGTQLNQTGAWTRARVEGVFTSLSAADRTRRAIMILRPAEDAEFLIADNPVTTHLNATGEVGTATRIGWDAADEIVMPFAPDLAIAFVRDEIEAATRATPVVEMITASDRVEQLNNRQVRGAQDYVFHLPGSDFTDQIRATLEGR